MIPALPPRLHRDGTLAPEQPGPAIAHCGAWWPLTMLPWDCPRCGERLGVAAS